MGIIVDDICTENYMGSPHSKVHIRFTVNDQYWTLTTELGVNQGPLNQSMLAANAYYFGDMTPIGGKIRTIFVLTREPANSRTKSCWEKVKGCVTHIGKCKGPWLNVGANYNLI